MKELTPEQAKSAEAAIEIFAGDSIFGPNLAEQRLAARCIRACLEASKPENWSAGGHLDCLGREDFIHAITGEQP